MPADCIEAAICRLVSLVEGSAGVQKVRPPPVAPRAGPTLCIDQCGEKCGSVDHCSIDDLSFAGALTLEQGAQHPKGQEHSTPAHIGDQIERRSGLLVRAAKHVERA